ncbi:MAG: AAA family ATPase [Phenylobacterium sp.]|nr:AAA family ATPase [Phenylobacterium sp.]
MKPPVVVAMFGLSGVGKGWVARRVCARHPVVRHLEASALLRVALNQTGEALRTAAEDVMTDNQRRLAAAFASARAAEPDRPVLFDGHSVIDNDAGLVDIPVAVIAPLRPDHIVFVADTGAVIAARRVADTRRRPLRSVADLDQHQARALAMAQSYAAALSVPFEEVQSGEWERVSRMFDADAGSLDSR